MGRYSVEKIVKEISKLQTEEFLGVCKVVGVSLLNEDKVPKSAFTLFEEIIEKLGTMNRTQRKNLTKLLRAANEDR